MKIALFSNFLNHHQLPVCEELLKLTDGNFWFVAFEKIEEERVSLGYEDMNQKPFVIRAYENNDEYKRAEELCMECDVVIYGSAPESFFKARKEKGLITFRFSERILKKGIHQLFSPRAQKRIRKNHSKYKKNTFLLCASAFSSADYAKFGAYRNKAFKWGYFPKVKKYDDIDALIDKKKPNSILWVARLIELKHPEYAIAVAERLKKEGYELTLDIVGNGVMEETLADMIKKKGLEDYIKLRGSMSPDQVREYMEKSEIFLFTSDRHEGWGAVLNESMNSGCAVVASHIIGSAPFLVEDGKNGLMYKSENIDSLYDKVKILLDNPENRKEMGKAAYLTMAEQWNPQNAAKRFYELSEALLKGEKKDFENGVCSKAKILKDNWKRF